MGVSGEVGLSGFSRSRIRAGRLRGEVGGRRCLIIAKFCMESLHFLHTGRNRQLVASTHAWMHVGIGRRCWRRGRVEE